MSNQTGPISALPASTLHAIASAILQQRLAKWPAAVAANRMSQIECDAGIRALHAVVSLFERILGGGELPYSGAYFSGIGASLSQIRAELAATSNRAAKANDPHLIADVAALEQAFAPWSDVLDTPRCAMLAALNQSFRHEQHQEEPAPQKRHDTERKNQ